MHKYTDKYLISFLNSGPSLTMLRLDEIQAEDGSKMTTSGFSRHPDDRWIHT